MFKYINNFQLPNIDLLLIIGIIIDSYYMMHLDKILSLVNFLLSDVCVQLKKNINFLQST